MMIMTISRRRVSRYYDCYYDCLPGRQLGYTLYLMFCISSLIFLVHL